MTVYHIPNSTTRDRTITTLSCIFVYFPGQHWRAQINSLSHAVALQPSARSYTLQHLRRLKAHRRTSSIISRSVSFKLPCDILTRSKTALSHPETLASTCSALNPPPAYRCSPSNTYTTISEFTQLWSAFAFLVTRHVALPISRSPLAEKRAP